MSSGSRSPGRILDERAVTVAKEANTAVANEAKRTAKDHTYQLENRIGQLEYIVYENRKRITQLEKRREEDEEKRGALVSLGIAAAISYTDYVDAANSVKRELKKAARGHVAFGGELLTFASNVVMAYVPVKVPAVLSGAAGLMTDPAFSSLEDAIVDSLVEPETGFIDRLRREKKSIASAVPRFVQGATENLSHEETIELINTWIRELNETGRADYEAEIQRELQRFRVNVLAIGGGIIPFRGMSSDEYLRKQGKCEVHWIDISGKRDPERTYLAQVAFHRPRDNRSGPKGLWHWNYPFLRWVDPVYAPDAIARGTALQKEKYTQILDQPSPILMLSPDQPLVTSRYIGGPSEWAEGDLNGKPLEEALGSHIDEADRDHELLYMESPTEGHVYSKWTWNLRK